ncbi:MAG: hypothetical protein HZB51_18755 [Chloroflexi bacterium]|nr:hypothetical protein [Chloroflexota bacterium]
MKILVFTEGTLFIGANVVYLSRAERIRATQEKIGQRTPVDFSALVPAGNAVEKLQTWRRQGAEIMYLTSRTRLDKIEIIRSLLRKFDFPEGELFFCRENEAYKDVAERVWPDVIVEDDCESIGGEIEMTYPHIRPAMRAKIKSIVVPEAGGIDHLPENVVDLSEC